MPRIVRFIKFALALLIVGFCIAAAAIATSGLSDQIVNADMVVVPGNTVHPDGTLSNRLKGRLDIAIHIFRTGNCQAIFVSGGTGSEGVDESFAMSRYLVEEGIPPANIIQDSEGNNTEATARNAASAMHQRKFTTVLAVSQYFHIPRLRLLLQRQGLSVVGNAHATYFEPRDAYSLAREVVAIAGVLLHKKAA
jgi:vancomycin permeability regulator SanA